MKTLTTLFVLAIFHYSSIITNAEAIEEVGTELKVPWAVVKLGKTFYVTERNGFIVEIENNKVIRKKVILKKPLSQVGEGGLLGFQLAPNSAKEGFIYYTYREESQIFNRVSKVESKNNTWVEIFPLIDRIPGAAIHNGGRVKIGPDQKLYVTTGDAAREMLAQQLNSLAGKILRLELDGSIPLDNPFKQSYVFSYGHRNPQGITWNQKGDKMYASEHGPIGFDEINEILPGVNYGWPLIKGSEKGPNMKRPMFHSANDTWAPAGIAYKDDVLYVATLRGEKLLAFDLHANQIVDVYTGAGRLRDIMIERENIFLTTSNRDGRGNPTQLDDRLLRIRNIFIRE